MLSASSQLRQDKCGRCLSIVDYAVLPEQTDEFNPNVLLEGYHGLFVWEQFRTSVLVVVEPLAWVPSVRVGRFRLKLQSRDDEIRADLSDDHVFPDPSIFWPHLARMIKQQEVGGAGLLFNDSHTNIFYVCGLSGEIYTVFLYWRTGKQQWCLGALQGNACEWYEGGQVICHSTAV